MVLVGFPGGFFGCSKRRVESGGLLQGYFTMLFIQYNPTTCLCEEPKPLFQLGE